MDSHQNVIRSIAPTDSSKTVMQAIPSPSSSAIWATQADHFAADNPTRLIGDYVVAPNGWRDIQTGPRDGAHLVVNGSVYVPQFGYDPMFIAPLTDGNLLRWGPTPQPPPDIADTILAAPEDFVV
jgi:hypothetical protein